MKFAVIGATGKTGGPLVDLLLDRGNEVRVLVRETRSSPSSSRSSVAQSSPISPQSMRYSLPLNWTGPWFARLACRMVSRLASSSSRASGGSKFAGCDTRGTKPRVILAGSDDFCSLSDALLRAPRRR
ncbi:MAG: SDR family oxidoreductase [Candidatus Nanopelagicales bacterium]|nr:SDR family oxidoreductase [Candidatus Nanopelagicales bacterium]